MSVFLIVLFSILFVVFGVLAYGALQDGLRLLYVIVSVVCFVFVLVLGLRLALQDGTTAMEKTEEKPKAEALSIPESAPVRADPIPPKAAPVAVPATLPQLVAKGSSFHLEPGQSTPLFRVPLGKRAHVAVFGGGLSVFSGGVQKLTCERRGFAIVGRGDANQLVACDAAVDVLIDDVAD